MDIEEAFTTEAIGAAGTNVSGDEETRLAEMIRHVYSVHEVSHNDDLVNLAMLMFVAGRTYQVGETRLQFSASPRVAGLFMEFLAQGVPEKE